MRTRRKATRRSPLLGGDWGGAGGGDRGGDWGLVKVHRERKGSRRVSASHLFL
jgi:hypothetical protein